LRAWVALAAALPVLLVAAPAFILSLVVTQRAGFFGAVGLLYQFLVIWFPLSLAVVGGAGLALHGRGLAGRRITAISVVCLAAAASGWMTYAYATHIEPGRLQVRRVTIETPKVDRPLRILHISDIQASEVDAYEERAFDLMRSLEPDLALHTGDLLQPVRPATHETEVPKLVALMQSLRPPLGVLNVPGNTDRPLHEAMTRDLGGWKTLFDESAELEAAGTRIRVLGLSLESSHDGPQAMKVIEPWLGGGDERDLTIVMGHVPNYMTGAVRLPVDLCLAGHTHGGQVRLPLVGPLLTLTSAPRSWVRGYREEGRSRLNVSAGIGAEHAPGLPSIRFLCPPEVTVIDFVPAGGVETP